MHQCLEMAPCKAGRRATGKAKAAPKRTVAKAKPAPSPAKKHASPTKSPGKLTKVHQRKLDSSHNHFAKAVGNLIMADNKEDAAYCKTMIDENPTWVPYLTSLFRRGTFENMMRQEADQSERREAEDMYGRLLRTRVKKIDRVPIQFKQTFLSSVNGTLGLEGRKEEDINSMFAWALMIDSTTPLPEAPNFRHEGLLMKACYQQYLKVGSVLHVDLTDADSHNFNFFALGSDSEAIFLPTKHKISLPGGTSMQWRLDNPDELHCTANSEAFKGCSQQLLPLVPRFADYDPSVAWECTEESVEEAGKTIAKFTIRRQ